MLALYASINYMLAYTMTHMLAYMHQCMLAYMMMLTHMLVAYIQLMCGTTCGATPATVHGNICGSAILPSQVESFSLTAVHLLVGPLQFLLLLRQCSTSDIRTHALNLQHAARVTYSHLRWVILANHVTKWGDGLAAPTRSPHDPTKEGARCPP